MQQGHLAAGLWAPEGRASQRVFRGAVKTADMRHDVAVYRAACEAHARIEAAGVEQFGVPRYEPAKVRRRWRDLIEYHDRSVVPDAPLSVLRRQDLWNGPDGDLTTSII